MRGKRKYQLANFLEFLRQYSPNWGRKILPKWFKNLLQDLQWHFYRQNGSSLQGRVKPLSRPILLITVPKCGTHLLRSIVLHLPAARWRGTFTNILPMPERLDRFERIKRSFKNPGAGHVRSGHIAYDAELSKWLDEQGIRKIFIYRDPRDYVVSHYHFIMDPKKKIPLFPLFSGMETNHSRLMACIRGIGKDKASTQFTTTSLPNVSLFYGQFLGWLEDPNTFSIQYEDIMANQPGHLNHTVFQKAKSMFEYLEILKEENMLSDTLLSSFLKSAIDPNKSPTFRLGKTGAWKDEFAFEHVQAFKEIAGDLLIQLGYEHDLGWQFQGQNKVKTSSK